MQLQVDSNEVLIEPVIDLILSTRRITRSNQERFMSILLAKKFLSGAEQLQVDRIFDGLRNGLIKVVD